MAYILAKKYIRTFEYRIQGNINIRKKNLYEKVNQRRSSKYWAGGDQVQIGTFFVLQVQTWYKRV